ncbi:MAG TPA: hypothetical protein DCZ92_03845 [Elusimicrobia bacterium]|nr:MAG: hypothetical protein A2016_01260 [Elusimicrobia bacterium GWF2_62_30]HBA59949.1 hypothetical protein [Elusimicrobiota bacterium]
MEKRAGLFLLLAALLAWGAGSSAAFRGYRTQFPPPGEIKQAGGGAPADMFALAFGARRLFADLWFVRLMQYYGTRELSDDEEQEELESHGKPGHHCHHGADFGKGRYPDFLPMSLHILQLDPGFTAACLYSAASLAFNLERPDEAEAVLNYGLRYSPKEWKYLSVLAAIGYTKAKDPNAVASAIAPMLKDPDCPVMLKQLAAFLNKRAGNYAAAAAIYADILVTTKDPAYLRNAARELEKLKGRTSKR